MFKKFTKDTVTGKAQAKSSAQRAIKEKLSEQFPLLKDQLDELIPKKQPLYLIKAKDHIQFLSVNDTILFFNHFDGPFYPTLHLLHKHPEILPKVQIDKGAIKFVLSGADVMCPGLISAGGNLGEIELEKGRVVCIMAEGKEYALGVGVLEMSSVEIKREKKGIAIERVHHLNDALWQINFSV